VTLFENSIAIGIGVFAVGSMMKFFTKWHKAVFTSISANLNPVSSQCQND